MSKIWTIPTLAVLALTLAACGGTPAPADPGNPPGSGLDPAACREVLTEPIRTSMHLVNHGEGCDYRIAGNSIRQLEIQATLTADPGTVVLVDPGVRVVVDEGASINLRGAADRPISFVGTVPERGAWDGFCFTRNHGESWFDNVHLVWAGNDAWGISATQCRGAIGSISAAAPVNISNSIIFGSGSTGIEALRMRIGDFSNNRLSNNAEYGIRVSGENVSRLDRETDYAGRSPVLADGLATPNGLEHVYVWPGGSGVDTTDRVHEWKNLQVPYRIAPDTAAGITQLSFSFGEQTRTVIEAGAELLIGKNVSLTVDADAIVMLAGASGNEVVIRGDSPDAGAGHWDGIDLKNGALISNHAEIRHGGRYAGVGAYMATIAFGGLGPVYHCSSVDNTLIADSESVGIRIGDAYTDLVHVGSVGFEGIAGDPVQGVAAGPAVTTIEEALDCLR